MLLSRVAESVYWVGRYLERAEDIARLAAVHTGLYLDLPRAAGLGWSPLLGVTGSDAAFHARHGEATEEQVIRFLSADADNPGSVIASLSLARANLRITRTVFPSEAWHALNELHQWGAETIEEAVNRRTRLEWMDGVIRRCQLLSGLMAGVMSHDQTYSFLEIGRYLERADMTTRVLDVQAGILLGVDDRFEPYADVTWTSVLRSLSAQQMFRRTAGGNVSGPQALRFLLSDAQCPRSVEHCLTVIARSLLELPRCQEPMATCAGLQEALEEADVDALAEEGLHQWVDAAQLAIAGLHDRLADTYFRMAPSASDALLTSL
jgi:uncharacterized alpha-E superfamily protein